MYVVQVQEGGFEQRMDVGFQFVKQHSCSRGAPKHISQNHQVVQQQDGTQFSCALELFQQPLHILDLCQVFGELAHAHALGIAVVAHSVQHEVVAVQFLEVHDEGVVVSVIDLAFCNIV